MKDKELVEKITKVLDVYEIEQVDPTEDIAKIISLCRQHDMQMAIDAAEKVQDKIYEADYHKYPEFKTDANDGIGQAIEAIRERFSDDSA